MFCLERKQWGHSSIGCGVVVGLSFLLAYRALQIH